MRTHFEPEQSNEFEAAKELFIRRCSAWAGEQQLTVDPFILDAALDFRHYSVDGRLGFWTVDLVRVFLLDWIPRQVSVSADDAADIPGMLLTMLRYLHHTALDDPTGDALPDIEAAIAAIAGDTFRQAMSDERNFGIAKFWAMRAITAGIDPTDEVAMRRFADSARAGRVEHDDAILNHIVTRHLRGDGGPTARACSQLPVSLPPEHELAAMAEDNRLVRQLRALTDWVGAGRALTATGQLKLVDARELIELLDTGDTVDPVVGGRVWRTKSSSELAGLILLVEWAKKLRLIRVVKNRLVRVAKSQPLLRAGLALWTAAFNTFNELADAVVQPRVYGHAPGMLHDVFDEAVPDVLNTIYGMPAPVPVERLAESVWLSCQTAFDLDDEDESRQSIWRQTVEADLRRMLRILAEAGGVEQAIGPADPMFLEDLDDSNGLDGSDDLDDLDDLDENDFAASLRSISTGLPPDARERLRAALAPDAGPVETVALSHLGTHAVRVRLLAEGRYMPLVGELTGADPARLLGMIAQHYTPETGQEEILRWLAAHGGEEAGLDRLLDAVRSCPFRHRAAAMLDALCTAQPDRTALLQRLRSDPALGPIAVQFLVEDEELDPDSLTERESLLAVTEQLIQLLEIAGPDAVRESFAQASSSDMRDLFGALLGSGHPDAIGLDELRRLVIEPLQHRGNRRPARGRPSRSVRSVRPKR
ncbi:hypothetical protein [Frankia sp. CiP3]|uniref:hypothetical protein n=1 Tax=Frankia sp. CiP3 TaxID=2880971 RepID=UPI001EF3F2CF|nr:hypothetical protein [Frankia sp. CiP3]